MDEQAIAEWKNRLDQIERENADLVRRLAAIERPNRSRTRVWIVAALIFGVGATLVVAEKQPQIARTIEARNFVLRDREGNVKGLWETDPNGMPVLSLHDKHGSNRAEFRFRPDGSPVLHFLDRDGRERMLVGIDLDGAASMALIGKRGKERVCLGIAKDGWSTLSFYDPDMKNLLSLDVHPTGVARMRALRKDGKVAYLVSTRDNATNSNGYQASQGPGAVQGQGQGVRASYDPGTMQTQVNNQGTPINAFPLNSNDPAALQAQMNNQAAGARNPIENAAIQAQMNGQIAPAATMPLNPNARPIQPNATGRPIGSSAPTGAGAGFPGGN